MINFKRIISLGITAAMTISLAACSSTNNSNSNQSQSNENVSQDNSVASNSSGTIEFWTPFTGADGENMKRLIDQYNSTNPPMQVVHRPIEANDLYTKIPTTVSSKKDVPDLTIVHAERVPLFIEQAVIMPLTNYINTNGNIKAENYVEQAWNVGTKDSNQYTIPLDMHGFVTYYNKDLVEKYGPNVLDDGVITIDEVKEVGQKSIQDDIYGMGITWMRVKYLGWLKQMGADISDDGVTPNLDSAEGEKILQEINEMVKAQITTQDGDDPGQMFRSQQVVFLPEGCWMQNSMAEIPNLNWGMTHFITFDANKKANWSSSHQFVMLNNPAMTDEKAAAIMNFIEWVGNNSLEWAKGGQVPAAKAIRDNEEFKQLPHSFLAEESDTLALYDYKYYGYAVEALDKVLFEAIFDRMTPKDALSQAQKETEDLISASK